MPEASRGISQASIVEDGQTAVDVTAAGLVRALRILSELEAAEPVYRQWGDEQLAANPYETALYRDLLGTLVLTNPRLLSAASLPETVRARAQEILDSGGAGIGAGWAGGDFTPIGLPSFVQFEYPAA